LDPIEREEERKHTSKSIHDIEDKLERRKTEKSKTFHSTQICFGSFPLFNDTLSVFNKRSKVSFLSKKYPTTVFKDLSPSKFDLLM